MPSKEYQSSSQSQKLVSAKYKKSPIQNFRATRNMCNHIKMGFALLVFKDRENLKKPTKNSRSEQRKYPTPHSTHIQLILGLVSVTQVTLVRSQQPRSQALWGDEIRDPGNEVEKSALS